MTPDDHLKVELLFGLLSADAKGSTAIAATIMLLVVLGAGRRLRLW